MKLINFTSMLCVTSVNEHLTQRKLEAKAMVVIISLNLRKIFIKIVDHQLTSSSDLLNSLDSSGFAGI